MQTKIPILKVPRLTEKLAHELMRMLYAKAEACRAIGNVKGFNRLTNASKHIGRVINRQADKREKLLKMILLSRWIYTGGNPRSMADVNDMRWILSDPYAYIESAFNVPTRGIEQAEKILDLLLSGDLERAVNQVAGVFEEDRDSLTVKVSQQAYNDMMEDLLQ